MVLELDRLEDERRPSSMLSWITVFELGEAEVVRGSRPLACCSIVGCSGVGTMSGVLSFVAGC